MKRKLVTLLCFALILAFAFCLVACNKTDGQLPTDKYEKVAFAFSGVARSLSGHGDAALSASAQTFYGTVAHADEYDGTEAVRTLYSLFDMREQTDDPDFKYDEPPMIQFQYIKALYDEVGKDYEFGKIYTGTVTGHADFDFATGEKTVRQDYTSEARIDIDIDENDLITVHLGLQTVYTHGSESHEQRFYAELYLDYDMTKTEPNYELTMKYVDDCSRFASESERTNTYEYDFVNVKQGAISEWRKLYHCSPTRLVRDAEHTSFAAYADAVLYGGRAHAYKDGVKYATNHTDVHGHSVNYALRRSICALFFDSFGLNATDIASDAYFAETGASNPALKSIFDRFSEITGMDVIAAMAVTGADDVYTGTPVENGNGDNGGNENGGGGNVDTDDSARNWALAEDLQKSYLGEDGPLFTSSGSVANVTKEENECRIDLRGVTEAEVVAYVEALLRAGFQPASTDGHFNKEVEGKTLTVVLSGGEDDALILHLSRSEIQNDGGKTDGGNGGESGVGKIDGGQEGGGEDGGGKIDGGGNGGKEDQNPFPEGDPSITNTTKIEVCYVTKGEVTGRDERTCTVGAVIEDVSAFFGGEAYYDQSGTRPLPMALVVSTDLTVVYVVQSSTPSEVRVYIVDVDADGSESAYASVPVNYGSDYSFRYYEYVLFEDAACTKAIDPNVPRTLTEDVTVYRRDFWQEAYYYLPIRFFINDVDVTFTASVTGGRDYLQVRRGKIFDGDGSFGFTPFFYGKYYYDRGKSSPLFTEKGNCVYFDESNADVSIFAYLDDPNYHEVTYRCGETIITKVMQYDGDYVGKWSLESFGYVIENPVQEGYVVTVDSYTRMNRITVKHVIDGKVVGENHMYFESGSEFEIFEEEYYYTDAALSTPYFGKLTGSVTLYKDFTPRESTD